MPPIRLDRVTKVYAGDVLAVDDVSLEVADGEFIVLVGPSGCGKSTLLRVVAGLEQVTRGRVWIGDEDVTTLDPPDRDLAMVFQSYALYPHKTVRENLAFGLRRRKVAKPEIAERVDRMAAMLGLGELMERKPAALSGGQRQRVAMGRALVREPRAFLMDEPLSNLDAKLRTSMRGELARLHERLPTTTVYVTHDQVEAMTLGQRVAVLRDGVIQQCDVPQRLFERPANLFVGAFIGSPAMNLVEARLRGDLVNFGDTELRLAAVRAAGDREVVLGLRPTSFAIAGPGCDPSWPRLRVGLDVVEQLGSECNLLFTIDAPPVATDEVKAAIGGESGADEGRLLADDRRARFTARIPGRPPAAAGGRVELAIDPSQLHLFDRDTGCALELKQATARAA
ncbi:MAG: ATP-binding cassette domain-containing protein [Solirubrobacterales bacterium]|nr:ATP-binding cassette domain-containing protein [Solirubrobacterales bacterium]